jgi:hypothetical protein
MSAFGEESSSASRKLSKTALRAEAARVCERDALPRFIESPTD